MTWLQSHNPKVTWKPFYFLLKYCGTNLTKRFDNFSCLKFSEILNLICVSIISKQKSKVIYLHMKLVFLFYLLTWNTNVFDSMCEDSLLIYACSMYSCVIDIHASVHVISIRYKITFLRLEWYLQRNTICISC